MKMLGGETGQVRRRAFSAMMLLTKVIIGNSFRLQKGGGGIASGTGNVDEQRIKLFVCLFVCRCFELSQLKKKGLYQD